MLQHIERTDSLVEKVLQQLTEAIINGRMAPDDKLVEARLAEQLGVSRGPVREAIRRLEQIGLVEKIPYRGTFVATLSAADIEELDRVRKRLEGLAVRILAERNDPQDIVKMEAVLDGLQKAVQNGSFADIFVNDADFHDTLVALTGNKLLNEVWAPVSLRLRRVLMLKRERTYHIKNEVVQIHRPIIEAIASGDPDLADAAVQRHIVL